MFRISGSGCRVPLKGSIRVPIRVLVRDLDVSGLGFRV